MTEPKRSPRTLKGDNVYKLFKFLDDHWKTIEQENMSLEAIAMMTEKNIGIKLTGSAIAARIRQMGKTPPRVANIGNHKTKGAGREQRLRRICKALLSLNAMLEVVIRELQLEKAVADIPPVNVELLEAMRRGTITRYQAKQHDLNDQEK